MRHFEISGNLENEKELNYAVFQETVQKVRTLYISVFGEELMNSIDLLVDNATGGTGPMPIITRVLEKYLIIKLIIGLNDSESKIAFQFAHELMHYVYYAKKGMNKERAGKDEEEICTAASLAVIKILYPNNAEAYLDYVRNHHEEWYRGGAEIAERVGYDLKELGKLIN